MPGPSLVPVVKTAIALPEAAIADFCRRWNVTEFALFGSVLRDDFRPDSDVDVMVTFAAEARPGLWDLAGMQEELEAMFGRDVDLLTRRGVQGMTNWLRRNSILDSAKVVYAR